MKQKNNKEHKRYVIQFGETTPKSGGTLPKKGNLLLRISTTSLIGTSIL